MLNNYLFQSSSIFLLTFLLYFFALDLYLYFKDLPALYNRGTRTAFLRHLFLHFCSARIRVFGASENAAN